MHIKIELSMQTGKRSYSRAPQAHRGTQKRCITGGYKDCVQKTILRLFPSRLAFDGLRHLQRLHELRRGYTLWNAGLVLGELNNEHNLHV